MNLFILDENPQLAAQMACDKHVVKMPLETAQMLCTAYHIHDPNNELLPLLYKKTHENHPCTKWVCETISNYVWTYMFWQYQIEEFKHRYGKDHLSYQKFGSILSLPPINIPQGKLTPFAQAMPDQYKHENSVYAYQQYYIGEKSSILTYTNRPMAGWLKRGLK